MKYLFGMVNCFFDAHAYPIDNCYSKRSEYIEYSAFKELIDYFNIIKDRHGTLYNSYKNRLIELSKKISLNNLYFDTDTELKVKLSCFKIM